MKKRGTVLREPGNDPGLLMIEGQQFKFSLDGIWKSPVLPKSGMTVDVELDPGSQILAITPVADSQLAREQAEVAMAKAKEKGGEMFGKLVAKFGMPNVIAFCLLILGWFFLATVSIQLPPLSKANFTFWQVLGLINASNALQAMNPNGSFSTGIYGLLAVIALLCPFVHYFWKDKRAVLGGVAPLLFMLVVWLMVRSAINNAFGGAAAAGGEMLGDMAKQMQAEVMSAVSLGLGAYVSGLVSLYFAGMAIKKFMAAKNAEPEAAPKSRQAAA